MHFMSSYCRIVGNELWLNQDWSVVHHLHPVHFITILFLRINTMTSANGQPTPSASSDTQPVIVWDYYWIAQSMVSYWEEPGAIDGTLASKLLLPLGKRAGMHGSQFSIENFINHALTTIGFITCRNYIQRSFYVMPCPRGVRGI